MIAGTCAKHGIAFPLGSFCPQCETESVLAEEEPFDLSDMKFKSTFAFDPADTLPPLQLQEGGSHYKDLAIQPVEYIHANGIPFIEGNVIKYVTRWREKGGLQDLRKARHFLDILLDLEEKKRATT